MEILNTIRLIEDEHKINEKFDIILTIAQKEII